MDINILIKAIENNDLTTVTSYFKNNPNAVNDFNTSKAAIDAFTTKIRHAYRTDIIDFMIDQGININCVNKFGRTPLLACVQSVGDRHCNMIKKLISVGADMEYVINNNEWYDNFNHTNALISAILQDNVKYAQILIEAGANVNRITTSFNTPLIAAMNSEKNSVEFMTMLVSAGVDVNMEGTTPKGNRRLLSKYMKNIFSAAETLPSSMTPLLYAVICGDITATQCLINAGADVNYVSDLGHSILATACLADSKEIFDLLIKSNIDVFAKNRRGENTIMQCAIKYTPCFDNLFDYKFTVDEVDNEGNTALMLAAKHLNMEGMKKLIQHGYSVGRVNTFGQTALYMLVTTKHAFSVRDQIKDYVNVLNYTDMNINQKDNNGETVLFRVLDDGYVNFDLFKHLINLGADPHIVNNNGENLLMCDVKRNKFMDVFNHLLKQKLDINHKNKKGETVLMYAVKYNNGSVVAKLVKLGANLNERDTDGRTVLMNTLVRDYDMFKQFSLLVKAGADQTIKDNKGLTVYDLAQQYKANNAGKVKYVKVLNKCIELLTPPQVQSAQPQAQPI